MKRARRLLDRILEDAKLEVLYASLALFLLITCKQNFCLSNNFTHTTPLADNSLATQPDSLLDQNCQSDVDFRTWIQEGVLDNGNWEVSVDPNTGLGRAVYQTINHDPTFFVSPDEFMNVRIRGKIRIEDFWDNDFVGFVFGYQGPNQFISRFDYEFLLFDWRAEHQIQEGREAMEGMTLSKVDGDLNGFDNMYNHFWQHDDDGTRFEKIATLWGDRRGWEYNTDYDFELVYTSTLVQIYINGQLVFDVPGCYQTGRFGFYNFSQQSVRYSDFSYELETNFETGGDVCLGQPSQFIFADTCAGADNATANLERWVWHFGDGSTSEEINPQHTYKHAGTYDVTLWVMDTNGCTDEVTKKVTVLPGPSLPSLLDTTFCQGRIFTVEIPPERNTTYTWQDGTRGTTYQISTPGEYWVVADNGVCEDREEGFVQFVGPVDKPDLGPDQILCEGDSITLDGSVVGATAYWWQDGNRDSTYMVSGPGLYRVIVANQCGIKRDTIQITEGQKPGLQKLQDQRLCIGESAVLEAQLEANALPYELTWSTGSSDLNIVVQPEINTTYWIDVNNYCGRIRDTLDIEVSPALSFATNLDTVSCYGNNDGKIFLENIQGTGDLQFAWAPAISQADSAVNLSAGNYSVTVTDEAGCTETQNVIMPQPDIIQIEPRVEQDISCLGKENGRVELIVEGGTGNYFYSLDGNEFKENSTFSDLEAGVYNFIVKDEANCTQQLTFEIQAPPPPVEAEIADVSDVNCFGEANGAISVRAWGGVAPYTYSLDSLTTNTTGEFRGLEALAYQIEVVDSRGCVSQVETEIEQPQQLHLSSALDAVVCAGGNTGAISMEASGGVGNLAFAWVPPVSTGPEAANLSAGSYQVTVEDEQGCTVSETVNLAEPPSLNVRPVILRDVNCAGSNDGAVRIEVSGGSGNYAFALDGGDFQPSQNFAGLTSGTHSVTVQDSSGCVSAVSFAIAEPMDSVSVELLDSENIQCFGGTNGRISLQAYGGTWPYEYELDGFGTDSIGNFNGLPADTFVVKVKDARGCVTELETILSEPPAIEIDPEITREIACYGDATGRINLEVNGGTGTYSYAWAHSGANQDFAENLPAGTYAVQVTDAENCSNRIEISLVQPPLLQANPGLLQEPTCFGESNGMLSVEANGGVEPYAYSWNNEPLSNNPIRDSLGAGNYQVMVFDSNGCQVQLEDLILNEPPEIQLLTDGTDITCYGADDGIIQLQASGGTGQFIAFLDNAGIEMSGEDGLSPGTYFVKVVDEMGCEAIEPVELREPDPIDIDLVDFSDSYCNLPNGSALVNASGGNSGDYTYTWHSLPDQRNPFATELPQGIYQVTATDSRGCETELEVVIGGNPPPNAAFTHNHIDEDSVILKEATFEFLNKSSRAVRYEWDFGDGNPLSNEVNPVHSFADTGTYTVVLTAFDENNACPDVDSLQMHVFYGGQIYVPNAFTPNTDGHNDSWNARGVGVTDIEIIIFDRWGLEITRINSLEYGWNGKNRHNRDVQEGVYVYLLNATLNTGVTYKRAGTITLIR